MSLDKTDWRSLWYTSAYSLNTWRLGQYLSGSFYRNYSRLYLHAGVCQFSCIKF